MLFLFLRSNLKFIYYVVFRVLNNGVDFIDVWVFELVFYCSSVFKIVLDFIVMVLNKGVNFFIFVVLICVLVFRNCWVMCFDLVKNKGVWLF